MFISFDSITSIIDVLIKSARGAYGFPDCYRVALVMMQFYELLECDLNSTCRVRGRIYKYEQNAIISASLSEVSIESISHKLLSMELYDSDFRAQLVGAISEVLLNEILLFLIIYAEDIYIINRKIISSLGQSGIKKNNENYVRMTECKETYGIIFSNEKMKIKTFDEASTVNSYERMVDRINDDIDSLCL